MQLPEHRYQFSPYKEKRSVGKILLIVALVILVGAGIYYLIDHTNLFQSEKIDAEAEDQSISKGNSAEESESSLLDLWNRKEYAQVNKLCEEVLSEHPLEGQYLALNGFSFFYRGSSLYTLEDQIPLYDKAIQNLRKVLILEDPPMLGQVHYVLGKTYYHKGRFYTDLAVEHLEKSLAAGYEGSDSYRYLGLSYGELGQYENSIQEFLKAAEKTPDALLYMTIGQSYFKIKKMDKALDFLMRAVHSTNEETVEKKSRFLIGTIYIETEEYGKAKDQYEKILSIDPDSADAHYYLGEIYDKMGEPIKARAEWRKVLNIDPSHYGALLKLY